MLGIKTIVHDFPHLNFTTFVSEASFCFSQHKTLVSSVRRPSEVGVARLGVVSVEVVYPHCPVSRPSGPVTHLSVL